MNLKFALALASAFLAVSGVVAVCFVIIWSGLDLQAQALIAQALAERTGLLMLFAFLLLLALGYILNVFFRWYVWPPKSMAEEMQLILTANPRHRIQLAAASELRQLAATINSFADQYQELQADVQEKIRAARADMEEEKNRLAALMSELTQGVLVCNIEGRILLYNNRARQVLSRASEKKAQPGTSGFVGLGRSVFGIIDRNLIAHALETIHRRLEQENASPVAHFVTTIGGDQLIRVAMAPVLDRQKHITGVVLTIDDITRRVEVSSRRDVLLQSLTEGTRASLANIRAAIETMLEYPDMSHERHNQFTQIIRDETIALSAQLDTIVRESAEYLKTEWPLEEMLGSDLISAIQRRCEHTLDIAVKTEALEEPLWLKLDSYSVTQALTYVLRRLKTDYGISNTLLNLQKAGRFAQLDLVWNGGMIDTGTLRTWENQPLLTDGQGSPLTLKEVAERHGGEVWYQADKATQTAYLRLLLPLTQPEPIRYQPVAEESRPEYYDFDLFHQPGQTPEIDQRRLTELTYTVFDTETTGLRPSEGDEIVSIGAVRIVNGRLLQQEIFEQLVDPRRPVSPESARIHRLSPPMLKGQPTIEQVLPLFFQFTEDTVLVAHNAAFDMRFLQLKEAQTGLIFTHPVLDTLLLSAVVHPNQEEHSLEAIAQRFGINIIGRHTALGDAIVTGEVFLKLVPLLAEKGILTLKDAREAAQKTFYARLQY